MVCFRKSNAPPHERVVDGGVGSGNSIAISTAEATVYCSYILGDLWNVDYGSSHLHYGQTFRHVKPLKPGTSAKF